MSSDEQYLEDPDARDDDVATSTTAGTGRSQAYGGRDPQSVDEMRATDDPYYAPQGPGDVGYEAPLVVPELDLEGGTKFVVGEDEYGSMKEANEALAPEDDVVVEGEEGDQVALTPAEETTRA
jgi:hypothetical protein